MGNDQIILRTETFVRSVFENEASGHDWWHMHRVRKMALFIAKQEGADLFKTELLALMHDLDDWKFVDPSENPWQKTQMWMAEIGIDTATRNEIMDGIKQISFKGANVYDSPSGLEAKIVQDADRLDAIGAIGIARAFAFGGSRNRLMHDPEEATVLHQSFEEYQKSNSSTVNHFYEKLLLLKDRMNTETAKHMAEKRHSFMLRFLDHFMDEWNCIY